MYRATMEAKLKPLLEMIKKEAKTGGWDITVTPHTPDIDFACIEDIKDALLKMNCLAVIAHNDAFNCLMLYVSWYNISEHWEGSILKEQIDLITNSSSG